MTISPSGTKVLIADFGDNLVAYVNATTSSLVLLQKLGITSSSGPIGVTFVVETIALVCVRGGNIQRFTLTNTSITYDFVVNSVAYWQSITFFPGSKSQGFIGSYSDTLNYFYYNGTQLVVTKTLLTASTSVAATLTNSNPYSRLIVATEGTIMLYALCSVSGCAPGGCDWNGNCLNGCSNSTPPRTGTNCSCPSGYADNGIDAQCEVAYN